MAKQLTQITFDFSSTEETEKTVPETAPVVIETRQPEIVNEEADENLFSVIPKKIKQEIIAPSLPGKRGRKSLKDINFSKDLIQIPDDELLFKKQYYSIGEVAAMFRENQSLIRYWEIEFDILEPRKNRKGDRFFRPIDIKNLVLIYDLLRRRKFTIEGAKDYLKKNKNVEERFAAIQSLQKIKSFLLELKASL
jgi:DNA-binding transcriptional MerR regulator